MIVLKPNTAPSSTMPKLSTPANGVSIATRTGRPGQAQQKRLALEILT